MWRDHPIIQRNKPTERVGRGEGMWVCVKGGGGDQNLKKGDRQYRRGVDKIGGFETLYQLCPVFTKNISSTLGTMFHCTESIETNLKSLRSWQQLFEKLWNQLSLCKCDLGFKWFLGNILRMVECEYLLVFWYIFILFFFYIPYLSLVQHPAHSL